MTILKADANIFATKISEIVNKSLATGDFTSNLKERPFTTIIEESRNKITTGKLQTSV